MLRRYQAFLSRLYVLLDMVAGTLALLAAWGLRFETDILPQGQHLSFAQYMSILLFALPAMVLVAGMLGLYGTTRNSSGRVLAGQMGKAVALTSLAMISVLYLDHQLYYSRGVLLFFVVFSWLFSFAARTIVQRTLRAMRSRGLNRKFLLMVGRTGASDRFLEQILLHPEFGYQVLGYLDASSAPKKVDDDAGTAGEGGGAGGSSGGAGGGGAVSAGAGNGGALRKVRPIRELPCLGAVSQLDDVLSRQIVDHVVLTLPHDRTPLLAEVIEIAESHGIHTILVPDFLDALPSRPRIEEFAGLPIIDTRYTPLDEAFNQLLKRAFDIVFSALVLAATSPLLLAVAFAVRASSPGPAIHAQVRLGKNRRPFRMYKFRTMWVANAETAGAAVALAAVQAAASVQVAAGGGAAEDIVQSADDGDDGWTVPNDPRVTPLGRFLRRANLDELPQFWNVLKGDMSVIGPRAERPHFVAQFRGDIPRYMIKHRVRPGISGWAQVNGLRGDTSIEDRIAHDLRYIESWTFGWDLRIIWLTLFKGFGRGAY